MYWLRKPILNRFNTLSLAFSAFRKNEPLNTAICLHESTGIENRGDGGEGQEKNA